VESGIEPDQIVAVFTLKDELVAVGRAKLTSKKMIEDEKGTAVVIERVFLQTDIYPKMVKK